MAWSYAEDVVMPLGPAFKIAILDITADAAYAPGGEVVDLSATFPNEVYGGIPIEDEAGEGYVVRYERAAAGAPATGEFIAYYCDYDAVADGALIECAAINLSTVCSGKWIFFGY